MKRHILLTTVAFLSVISVLASNFEQKNSLQFRYLVGENGEMEQVPSRFEETRRLFEIRQAEIQVKSQKMNPNIRAKSANNVLAPPSNDDFADRITISGISGTTAGSNVDATLESGEPSHGNSKTVWWSWTAPATAGYEFDTGGSDFDTFLAIFYGKSVDSLTLVAEDDDSGPGLQSLVDICAISGVTYKIQVSGYWMNPNTAGNIDLNWQPVNWSDWMLDSHTTNTYFSAFFADDLSVLSFKSYNIKDVYYRTNEFGCTNWMSDSFNIYPDGFTVTDKKNNKKVENKPLEGISAKSYIANYNDKQLLVYDLASGKLIVYDIKKDAFVKVGEQPVENLFLAWFSGSEIFASIFNWSNGDSGVKIFDKKLKKEKWNEPLGNGLVSIVKKGLTARTVWTDNENAKVTYKKKGKKIIAEHSLNFPASSFKYIYYDSKCGVLYWSRINNTNSPITYLDKKSNKVVDNQQMTDVGNVWEPQNYDGKTLYVSKYIGSGNYTFYNYKLKGLKKLGDKTVLVPNNGSALLDADKKAYIETWYNDSVWKYGFIVCDKKLKKELWTEAPAEGSLWRLTKDVFIRGAASTSGITTTLIYKLFNQKGEIVTYIFQYE